jgi:hypothetical protein
MNDRNKIALARDGALDLISFLGEEDAFSIMPFNNRVLVDEEPQPLKEYRPNAEQIVSSLIANAVLRCTTRSRLLTATYSSSNRKTPPVSRPLWC